MTGSGNLKNGIIYILAFVLLGVGIVSANELQVEIDGFQFDVIGRSVKCDIGEIPDISIKRLVNCDSATLVEFQHEDTKSRAIRFQISPSNEEISGGVRAELRDMYEAVLEEETWYRFSTLLKKDFPIDSKYRLVLAQWHERVFDGDQSLRPPLSHRLWSGKFVVTLWNQQLFDRQGGKGNGQVLYELPEIELGVFYEYVYKIVWSPTDRGQVVGWSRVCPPVEQDCGGRAWEKIIDHRGAVGFSSVRSYYFKLGLYTVSEFHDVMTAWHRDYRLGPDAKSVGVNVEVLGD